MNAPTLRAAPPPAAPSPVHAFAALAPPTPPDRPPEHDAAAPLRFAELLRERRNDAAPPRPPAVPRTTARADVAPARAAADAGDAPEPTADPTPGTPARTAGPAKARAPAVKPAAAKATADPRPERARSDDERASGTNDVAALAAGAAPHERSAALALAVAHAATPDGCTADRDASDIAARPGGDAVVTGDTAQAIDAQRGGPTAAVGTRARAIVEAVEERTATTRVEAKLAGGGAESTFASALADAAARAEPARPAHHARPTDAVAAPIAATGAAAAAGEPRGVAAAPAGFTLATPIDSPDFAAALGVQLSVLVRDGIERAELHLHPVETGPVSIRIEVDGTNARVDFGADLAATRQAIEQGLPELASALRDAGLTLAGGGVSQHAGSDAQRGDDGADGARARPAAAATSTTVEPTRAARRRVAAGGVDLYA